MDNNILAAYIFPRFSGQYKLNGAWHFKPDLSGRHASSHVRRTHARGKCAQSPVCTGMGICADNTFPGSHNAGLRKDRMLHTGFTLLKIPGQPLLLRVLADCLRILRRLNILVRRKMIRNKYHLILVKDMIRHLLNDRQSHGTGNIIRHNHVKLRLDQLTCFHRIKSCVGSQNLLRHCHSHKNNLPL